MVIRDVPSLLRPQAGKPFHEDRPWVGVIGWKVGRCWFVSTLYSVGEGREVGGCVPLKGHNWTERYRFLAKRTGFSGVRNTVTQRSWTLCRLTDYLGRCHPLVSAHEWMLITEFIWQIKCPKLHLIVQPVRIQWPLGFQLNHNNKPPRWFTIFHSWMHYNFQLITSTKQVIN